MSTSARVDDREELAPRTNGLSVRCHELAETSRSVEEAARRGLLEDGPQRVEEMSRELELVCEALPALWREMSSNPS